MVEGAHTSCAVGLLCVDVSFQGDTASNWTATSFNAAIFRYTFSGQELAGPYTWLAACTGLGTLNIIGETARTPFTFGP